MNLIFEETLNRHQCGGEAVLNDLILPCTFSTSKSVTIPDGLRYAGGVLELNENSSSQTIPICRNHENRLRAAFAELLKNTNPSKPSASSIL
jgi:hypothetical protein